MSGSAWASATSGLLLIIGGNGSMAAAKSLSEGAIAAGYPLQVIGVPKTIDNDIAGTETSPGYGSAARFIAQSVHDAGLDLWAMRDFDEVVLFEVMGRYSGWLAAASSLARWSDSASPHLLSCCRRSPWTKMLSVPQWKTGIGGRVFVWWSWRKALEIAMAPFSPRGTARRSGIAPDRSSWDSPAERRHISLSYCAARLELRCRHVRPETIQRSSAALASEVDRASGQASRRGCGPGGGGRAVRNHDSPGTDRRWLEIGARISRRGRRS